MLHHAEILYRDGVAVGDVRVGTYGHTLGGAVGLAHVSRPGEGVSITPKYLREGSWEVDIAGTLYPATVSLKPMYDPQNEKIKM